MSTRRPLQALSPPSANIANTRHNHASWSRTDGYAAMEGKGQEDMQDLASVVSGLSSLENDADDDFERLMIQNARDERRLNEARSGRVQAFRKARTNPRVGLTMDNLERSNAWNEQAARTNAHVKAESPASSSGSTRSDPAIYAPPGWGRKSRVNRNWMRTITHDDDQQWQTPKSADRTVNGNYSNYQQHTSPADNANVPRQSIEDSPLSHKSSIHGTPRNQSDWDLTFELNEASIIASTPYIPRNTVLDDIRQREIESLKEQAVTTARLDRIREGSPELMCRPRSASNKSGNMPATEVASIPQEKHDSASPEKPLRKRTNSWQPIGKAQAVTGMGTENSPITVYKRSTETVELTPGDAITTTHNESRRPLRHRREDSQDLLRRLARVSNTPSPRQIAASRPQTAPVGQPSQPSEVVAAESQTEATPANADPSLGTSPSDSIQKVVVGAIDEQNQDHGGNQDHQAREVASGTVPQAAAEDVDATPMPVERSILNPKTPVVTGAWVDTPGPRTIRKTTDTSRFPSFSPKKASPQKRDPSKDQDKSTIQQVQQPDPVDFVRPQLPGSALQALVEEARASGDTRSADYGDSTINSLEELISSVPEGEIDEDTLQGLQLPTGTPRNEAERQRQQELLHLHRMNDRLRAARTSIRDVSRGIKRVEDQVEHSDELGQRGAKPEVVMRECPCAAEGGHIFSLWTWCRSFYWDPRLKTEREGTLLRTCGGLTGLSIFLIVLSTYWISEEIACEFYCHHPYANYSPYPFGVNPDAPQYPYVIPTLLYRNFIKFWWLPLSSFVSWIYSSIFGVNAAAQFAGDNLRAAAQNAATQTAAWATQSSQVVEELIWDQSMSNDEIVR